MSHNHQQSIPPQATWSVLSLIALTLIAVIWTKVNNLSTTPLPLATVVSERYLTFEDHEDGAVHVFDAEDHSLVHVIPSQSGHFVRVMLRSMVRERRDNGLQETGAFIVAKRSDGHLTLQDSVTGRVIVLRAFGETNAQAFGLLLNQANQDTVGRSLASQ